MGRPSFRGVVLRDHGTERLESLPTMGTAPKTQETNTVRDSCVYDPERVVPTLGPPSCQQTKRDNMTDKTGHTAYHTISQAKSASQAPSGHRNTQSDFPSHSKIAKFGGYEAFGGKTLRYLLPPQKPQMQSQGHHAT